MTIYIPKKRNCNQWWSLGFIGKHTARNPTADCWCAKWGRTFPYIHQWHNLDNRTRKVKWTHSTGTNFSIFAKWLGTNVSPILHSWPDERS